MGVPSPSLASQQKHLALAAERWLCYTRIVSHHSSPEYRIHDRAHPPRPRFRLRQDRAHRVGNGAHRGRRRDSVHRRFGQGAHRGRRGGDRGRRPHGLAGDHGRPGKDPASQNPRRPSRPPGQRFRPRGDGCTRHPAHRSTGGQSLSLRGGGDVGRQLRDLYREHRHRRTGDDPGSRQEPCPCDRRGRPGGLRAAGGRNGGERRRDHARVPQGHGRQGLPPDGRLRCRYRPMVRGRTGRRISGTDGVCRRTGANHALR